MGVAAEPGPQIEAATPSQPAAHSAAVAAAAGPAVVFARAAVVSGLGTGGGGRGAEAAEAGREERSGRAGGAGSGRLPGSVGAARWLGRIPRGPGGGGERVAGPAMADNEKLDNQRLKNFKNKGRDLEVQ